MKKTIVNFLSLALACVFVYFILEAAPDSEALAKVQIYFQRIETFYRQSPVTVVFLFCLAHFISSSLGLPGGCTALNISSGLLFGFWMGCLIVYPVTMVSAFAVYLVGRSGWPRVITSSRWKAKWTAVSDDLMKDNPLFLISLRLSPFFPFGVLNFLLGRLGVPTGTFLSTTLIGVFFDVTLLNSLGAALRSTRTFSDSQYVQSKETLAMAFAGILILFVLARVFLLRSNIGQNERDRT